MAKTILSEMGEEILVDNIDLIEKNVDIVSGKATSYSAHVGETQFEISKKYFDALEETGKPSR